MKELLLTAMFLVLFFLGYGIGYSQRGVNDAKEAFSTSCEKRCAPLKPVVLLPSGDETKWTCGCEAPKPAEAKP